MKNLMKYIHTHNLKALAINILIVYVAYFLCRIIFYLVNLDLYGDVGFGHLMELLGAGVIFDTSAILYTNAIIILMFLFPLHWKENKTYYRVARWIYTVVNSLCIALNMADCVYFQYTGKRTTMSVVTEFENEGAGNMANILGKQFLDNWYLVLLAFAMFYAIYIVVREQ